jgi:hypothetical protein
MKKYLITLFIIGSCLLNAQDFKKTGTAGFAFLEIPVYSRTAGLGEASIALSDLNSSAIFINPAALGFTELNHSFSISYAPWIADIKHYAAGYSIKTDFGVFGIGALMFDYGTMTKTKRLSSNEIQVLGDFNANSLGISLSYSKKLTDKFSFGLNGKYVQETIDIYSADNFLLDGGILYYTGLSSLRIAAVIQNFGVDSKYINDTFKMPATLRLGTAAEVLGGFDRDYRVTLIAEALHPSDEEEKLNLATEISWQSMIDFRFGYKLFYSEESYNFGIGLKTNLTVPIVFDYAYSDYGRLGSISRISLHIGIL